MQHTKHNTEEQREANTARQHRHRAMETVEQHQQRLQRNADAHCQYRANNPQIHNIAHNFSESANTSSYSDMHQINVANMATCNYCNAFKLPAESPGMCCSNGKVLLAEPNVPLVLQSLFSSQDDIAKHFHDKIRLYNSAFTFTSVGVKLDNELANATAGVYTFRIQGSIYHQIGSLLPEPGSEPHYLQMYVWDTENKLYHRINTLSDSGLDPTIIQKNIKNLSMVIHANIPGLDQRTHNAPTASQVAAIWIDDDVPSDAIQKRDIVLRTQTHQLIRISEFTGCYDPLAYPLLFPHGEQGWAPRQIPYKNIRFETIKDPNDEDKIRSELYQGLQDAILHGDNIPEHVGRRIVLPATFIGSPRDMIQRYQDAMALLHIGKPDLFITMSCNPNWPEIQALLLPGQMAQDQPDITVRIFHEKLQELKKDVFERRVLGHVVAHTHVIEFQKQGLPHAHILIILHPEDKPQTPDDYDDIVCAEIPDPVTNPRANATVIANVFHRPCGSINPNAPCMIDDGTGHKKCTKGYPRQFQNETLQGEDFYPGHDKATIEITGEHQDHETEAKPIVIDEIHNFIEACWVSAPEAIWRILGFNVSGINPAVIRLQIHLPNQQRVIFNESDNLIDVVTADQNQRTSLTEYFKMNDQDPDARNLLYTNFPHYTWNKTNKTWKKRQRGVTGARSFEELKTVDDTLCATFKENAQCRGFLENDNEHQQCMAEARIFQMPSQLRDLFATLLVFGDVTDIHQLWIENFNAMAEDFAYNGIPEDSLRKVLSNNKENLCVLEIGSQLCHKCYNDLVVYDRNDETVTKRLGGTPAI
ncbi:9279_t:CDS:2 [Entrophospora sp. SA101]|nr:9279_t:CDS:2 [Entrophospora sp. SA101]